MLETDRSRKIKEILGEFSQTESETGEEIKKALGVKTKLVLRERFGVDSGQLAFELPVERFGFYPRNFSPEFGVLAYTINEEGEILFRKLKPSENEKGIVFELALGDYVRVAQIIDVILDGVLEGELESERIRNGIFLVQFPIKRK